MDSVFTWSNRKYLTVIPFFFLLCALSIYGYQLIFCHCFCLTVPSNLSNMSPRNPGFLIQLPLLHYLSLPSTSLSNDGILCSCNPGFPAKQQNLNCQRFIKFSGWLLCECSTDYSTDRLSIFNTIRFLSCYALRRLALVATMHCCLIQYKLKVF